MTPGAHLLISWVASVEFLEHRRERTLVTLSGLAPDIDGLGIVIDKLTGVTDYYFSYHHYLGHSILSPFVIATLVSWLATAQRSIVWVCSFVVVQIHVLCDVLGSKGPDGYQWPVYYLYPFNSEYELTWKYQWELDAWQNQLIIGIMFIITLYYASKRRITFLEVFSQRLNEEAFIMYDKYIRDRQKAAKL